MATLKGIDTSEHQSSKVDYSAAYKAGYDFAILRIGYNTREDYCFETDFPKAKAAGLKVGIYFYTTATTETAAIADAKRVLGWLNGRKLDLPVAYDMEESSLKSALRKNSNSNQYNAFANTIKAAGYKTMLYTGENMFNNYFNKTSITDPLWIAQYTKKPSVGKDVALWQYTSNKYETDFYTKELDRSYLYTTYEALMGGSSDTTETKGGNMATVQNIIDAAVEFATSMANDNTHGYSQKTRSLYNITNPTSFDCSSLTLTAYYYAFTKFGLTTQANYLKQNCSYTGNMLKLTNVGFEIVATNQTACSSMQKGDLELNTTHHVAMAISNNQIVHARSSEGTTDTKDGSGNEIRTQAWYVYSHGWTHRLRFTGNGLNLDGVKNNTTVDVPTTNTTTTMTSKDSSLAGTYKVTASSLNMRKTAGNGSIITSVAKGNTVTTDGTYATVNGVKWLYCSYGSTAGYMSSQYLSKVVQTTTTQTTTTYSKAQFIKDVQKAIGVTVDGIVGPKTLAACPTISATTNRKHAVVKYLQSYINALGYNCGTADGVAGAKFTAAAKSFQKAKGLTADGIFGKNSWTAILK